MKFNYKILMLSLLFIGLLQGINAQQIQECGTRSAVIPNFNQAEYEIFERDFLEKKKSGAHFEPILVPIKVHIVRPSNSVGGYTETELNTELTRVNAFYSNANIQFYICNDINYINNDDLYNYGASSAEEAALSAYNFPNIMNVFFTNMTAYCGYAYFPGGPDLVVMANICSTNGSTLAHEIGHYFGLYHTHDTGAGREFVNGSNCATAGDRICDTPADPNLSGVVDNTTNCNYTGTSLDPNGQAYMPDTRNVMSYSLKTCRIRFSAQQYARIAFVRQNSRAYLTCATITTCSTPATPSVSSITTASATVTWTAVGTATAYRVEYKTAAASTWTTLANTTSTSTSLTGLSPSTTYNVRVYSICGTQSSAASTTASFTTNSATACTDVHEPNNSFAQARVISPNSIVNGSITTSGDLDYFAFTTTAAAPNFMIDLGDLGADFNIGIYNSSQTYLTGSARSGISRDAIFYNATSAGTYYIAITGYNNAISNNCYRLTLITDASPLSCPSAATDSPPKE